MPCFAHRDATGKCNYTNQNCKFFNNLKADQEAGYKHTWRPRPRGKGKADKDEESKDGSDIEDPAPKSSDKTEAGASGTNPFKNPNKGAFHTFLGPPTANAQRAAMHLLNATVPKSASTSDGPKPQCSGAVKITQNTSQMDTMPWW
jgi:hypothetical protein